MSRDGHGPAIDRSSTRATIVTSIPDDSGSRAAAGPPAARRRRGCPARCPEGDYETTISRQGPSEIASLEEQERLRREFIANAAHELRTPLTNLQGYLEALRDGVIPAERATFESLWEEAEQLVRLSRSLDVLAADDAAPGPPHLVELDLAEAIRSAVELVRPALRAAGLERASWLERAAARSSRGLDRPAALGREDELRPDDEQQDPEQALDEVDRERRPDPRPDERPQQ